MNRFHVLIGSVLASALAASPVVAQTTCAVAGSTIPPGANTTDPSAPFFIDTTGLDLSTRAPTRNPLSPNYPPATELPDGLLPPIDAYGNFIIGPTHTAALETVVQPQVPKGTIYTLTLSSNDSVIYNPGVMRDEPCTDSATYGASSFPSDASNLILLASHPASWTRVVNVYVPAGYRGRGYHGQGEFPSIDQGGLPFIVAGDGVTLLPSQLYTVLDNLIYEQRLPAMAVVAIGSGPQDVQGSERSREYDAVSGTYAEWVEREVLPVVEEQINIRLTRDPDGRAAMGFSSSAAAAFTMAWFHPELYHRVLGYSPTMVNQQWPHDPSLPGGAWQYHSPWAGGPIPNFTMNGLIPDSPRRPIRYWFETGDRDLFYLVPGLPDGMHDWTLANENMARVLAARGYEYQFVFSRQAGHIDSATELQTIAEALQWLWRDYPNKRI